MPLLPDQSAGDHLMSRKWSGKTLADHRGDRKAWLTGAPVPITDDRLQLKWRTESGVLGAFVPAVTPGAART
jgi:hypothetical protein